MIRHMLLFRFKPDASEELKTIVLEGLRELPNQFPAMRHFGMGLNESRRDQTFTHVMTVEFDTEEQLHAYLNSPYHEERVVRDFRPAVADRAIASYSTAKS